MAKLGITTGTTPNDGNGDSLLSGAVKINSNFDEIYSFFGDGTNLTGAGVTYITAGSGISVDQNTGNVTITATGGGGGGESYWAQNSTGIHTLSNVGIGTTNPTSALTVTGDGTFTGVVTATTFVGALTGTATTATLATNAQGLTGTPDITVNKIVAGLTSSIIPFYWENFSDLPSFSTYHGAFAHVHQTGKAYYAHTRWVELVNKEADGTVGTGTENFNVGLVTATAFSGSSINVTGLSTFAGITTVTGTTLFTKQLNVSGISTLSNTIVGGATTQLIVNGDARITGMVTAMGGVTVSNNANTLRSVLITDNGSNGEIIFRDNGGSDQGYIKGIYSNLYIAGGVGGIITLYTNAGIFHSDGRVVLNNGASGTTQIHGPVSITNTLNVSGISTLGTVQISSGIVTATSGIVTYYGDTSNAADGRWTLGANGTSDYTFTGIGFTQTTNDPVLYLARGRVYEFVNNSGGSHPFQIRVSDGGAAYSDGVTNNAAATGVIRFEIPFNAPNTLYYQCTNHSGMGNTISVYPNTI